MRKRLTALGVAVLLPSCSQAVENKQAQGPATRSEAEMRAARQLEARLGAEPVLRNLSHGTEGGKPLLCGEATVRGQTRPFALRNGFLILPEDMTPAAFKDLVENCTAPGAA